MLQFLSPGASSPGLTGRSIPFAKRMDPRVEPAGDDQHTYHLNASLLSALILKAP
jgi:hypothetical protein